MFQCNVQQISFVHEIIQHLKVTSLELFYYAIHNIVFWPSIRRLNQALAFIISDMNVNRNILNHMLCKHLKTFFIINMVAMQTTRTLLGLFLIYPLIHEF